MFRARVVREIRSLRGNVKMPTITFARQVKGAGSTQNRAHSCGKYSAVMCSAKVSSVTGTKS